MKKGTKLLMLSLVAICLLTGCGAKDKDKDKDKDKPKDEIQNTDPEVVGDREVDGLKFTNASMIRKDGLTVFNVLVQNTTDTEYVKENIGVVFKDEAGNVIVSTEISVVGGSIAPGETKQLSLTIDTDITVAKSIEYQK